MNLTWLDILIILVPCALVLWLTMMLRSSMRSVADFLAAGRCAGRYLICNASAEIVSGATAIIINLEVFSQTGFSIKLWGAFETFIFFVFALNGIVTYRFRQTRSLTFHQFFEARYSKGIRMLAAFMNFVSGIIYFGIQPALGARFLVYFCGFSDAIRIGTVPVKTYAIVMVVILAIALYMALASGQISVLITNCVEGLVSGVFYILVAGAVLFMLSYSQMEKVLLSAPPGQSYVNPFDISGRPNFNLTFVMLLLCQRLYAYRGNAMQAGFAASAKSAHEGKMSGILMTWRYLSSGVMTCMITVGALVVLHDPHFAPMAAIVEQKLSVLSTEQLRTQMRVPVTLSVFLPMGVKGAFCAIALFGMIADLGAQMLAYGSTFIQDVIIPLRRNPMQPNNQILLLRLAAVGIALFAIGFGLWFKPQSYLLLITNLIGAIYLCIGAVVWGGLYWKKGTTAGAWASMTVGLLLAVAGFVVMQFWAGGVYPALMSISHHLGLATFGNYIEQHPQQCPLNPQILAVISYAGAGSLYVIVSLLTCSRQFNMDKLLHRGEYAVPELESLGEKNHRPRSLWNKLVGVTDEYTRGDRIIATGTAIWTIVWKVAAVVIIVWNLAFWRWSDKTWCRWSFFQWVICEGLFGVIATIWFTIGGIRDIIDLFRTIRTIKPDSTDNGMVASEAEQASSRLVEERLAELVGVGAAPAIAAEVRTP